MSKSTVDATDTKGNSTKQAPRRIQSIICEFDVVSLAPIGFSAPIQSKKGPDESHNDHEERTWRERMHVNSDGHVFVPPQALKGSLCSATKYRPKTVPGQGKKNYGSYFTAGVMVVDPIVLCDVNGKPIKAEDVEPNRLFVPSDGKPGGGSRVWKNFPTVPVWTAHCVLHVLEPMLAAVPQIVEEYCDVALKFRGWGQFRPERGGYFGRGQIKNFEVTSTEYKG